MKKQQRIAILMTILALVLAMTFVLAACDGTPDNGTSRRSSGRTRQRHIPSQMHPASAITAAKQ